MQEVRPTLTSRGVRTESVPPSEGTWTFFSKMIFFEVNDLTTSRPPRSDAAGGEEAMLALWMWTTFPAAQPLRARAARTRLLHWDIIFVPVSFLAELIPRPQVKFSNHELVTLFVFWVG